MCELMTIAAAAVFAAWHIVLRRRGRSSMPVFATMLMFLGAALMWGVDCVAEAMSGEELLDLSRDDALLGCTILAAGLAVFGVLEAWTRLCGKARCAEARA